MDIRYEMFEDCPTDTFNYCLLADEEKLYMVDKDICMEFCTTHLRKI